MGEGKLRAYLDPTCSEELLRLFEGSERWDTMRAEGFGAASAPLEEQLANAAELKRLLVTREGGLLEEETLPIRECPAGVVVFEAVPEEMGRLEEFLEEVSRKLDYYCKRLKVQVTGAGFCASTVPREGNPRTEFRKW